MIGASIRSTPAALATCTILEERYGRRSTILTSEVAVDKWREVIGDPTYAGAPMLTAAPFDRLLHHSTVVSNQGECYRLRDERRAAPLAAPAAASAWRVCPVVPQ